MAGQVFLMKYVNSGCTDEGAMIMAQVCGIDESILLLHNVLAQLGQMDQKLDHISDIVGKINSKITNQILNDGVDKVRKVIQDRDNRLRDVIDNQKKYWRLMAMAIGMIDGNNKKTENYNRENMLLISPDSGTKKDSVTLEKDSLARNRIELFHHYLTKWYKECESKGYRAEDLVKYMTRANNGLSYPWTVAYSGVAITAVPWENEAGPVVEALRAEDAAVLATQVVMEAMYCITSRSKYFTGKNIPENLLRAELDDIRENLITLKEFYQKYDPKKESSMAFRAKYRCTIPGCYIEFMADNDVNNNVTTRKKTFREIINEMGSGRGPKGGNDVEWWAFKEAFEKWKAMNMHKNEFNKDTCEMLTAKEVKLFNSYFISKNKKEKKDEYKTPFVEAVTRHIYPDDSLKVKRLWPYEIFLYPDESLKHPYQEVRGFQFAAHNPRSGGTVFSGWIDFDMYFLRYNDVNIRQYYVHRCHYHGGTTKNGRHKKVYFYDDEAWQPTISSELLDAGDACCGAYCNCPSGFKNNDIKSSQYLPSPKFKRFDIREAVINAAEAAKKALQQAQQ